METKKKEKAPKAPEAASEGDLELAEQQTREAIGEQETMSVIIHGEKDDGPLWQGCVNGTWYAYERNKLVEIPRTMYELIRSSAAVTDETAEIFRKSK